MTKMRNKKLNELLRTKRSSKHKAKFGDQISRARQRHLQNKEGVKYD